MSETQRTINQIENDLAAAQERLAENVTALIDKVNPRSVADRTVADAKSKAAKFAAWAKDKLFLPDSTLNVANAAVAGGGFVGLIVFLKLVKKLFSRK